MSSDQRKVPGWATIALGAGVVVIAAVFLYLGLNGEDHYESVEHLVQALNDEGVTCNQVGSDVVEERITGQPVTYDLGQCRMPSQDKAATIWVFPTEEDAATVRQEFGVRGRWIVGDSLWDVSAPSREAQKSIQEAIGGSFSSNI